MLIALIKHLNSQIYIKSLQVSLNLSGYFNGKGFILHKDKIIL